MAKTKATAKTQGAKAEKSKGKKAETQDLVKYEGKQKFVISKDFARFKKGGRGCYCVRKSAKMEK